MAESQKEAAWIGEGAPAINIRGRFVYAGSLEADIFDHPLDVPRLLRTVREQDHVIDVFTLVQTLPHAEPEFDYPMEWDNVAAEPVSTFDNWRTRQIDRKTRNMVRKSVKQGIAVRPLRDVVG
jgi:hypothetical protein